MNGKVRGREPGLQLGYINSVRLLRMYETIKKHPNRTYIAKDFFRSGKVMRPYLEVLVKLELIEQVPVYYKCGKKHSVMHNVRGYKFKEVKGIMR